MALSSRALSQGQSMGKGQDIQAAKERLDWARNLLEQQRTRAAKAGPRANDQLARLTREMEIAVAAFERHLSLVERQWLEEADRRVRRPRGGGGITPPRQASLIGDGRPAKKCSAGRKLENQGGRHEARLRSQLLLLSLFSSAWRVRRRKPSPKLKPP